MRYTFWSISHLIVLIALILWNYYSNSGIINNNTVGSVSDQFENLFTPAGFAFAIWGIIYLSLIGSGIYLIYLAFSKKKKKKFIVQAAPPLIIAHLGNAAWLYFWLNEQPGYALVIMFIILLALIVAKLRLNMERWDAPMEHIALVWWPVDLYLGWISVATIANVAAFLSFINWNGGGLSEINWTIVAIILVTVLSIFMILTRNMREFAGVVIWALLAIAYRHWGSIYAIQWTAVSAVVIIAAVSAVHAYRNKDTLPFVRKSTPESI